MPLKVIEVGINRKPIYDFLLVINIGLVTIKIILIVDFLKIND